MINLLSPESKRNIQAARRNVRLRMFASLSLVVTVGMCIVYGIGFYLVLNERAVAEQQLSNDKAAAYVYSSVLAQAKQYKSDLTVANKVLSSGMNYSNFLTTTAQTLPAGSILTTLSLTGLSSQTATAGLNANDVLFQARTTSYAGALQLKESLEKSDTFENVRLVAVKRNELTGESSPLLKKYPYEVSVNVVITKQKAGL